uniref:Cadherin domain-containing protein n=1 Tax=Leptobrachium leishanense TaxID=445787 RepID=A0A8C5MD74_9ANUR
MGSSPSPLTCCCFLLLLLPLYVIGESCRKVTLYVPSETIHSGSRIGKVDLHHCVNSYFFVRSSNEKFVVNEDGTIYAHRKILLPAKHKISFDIMVLDLSSMEEKKIPVKIFVKPQTVKPRYTRELLKRTKRRWQPFPSTMDENYAGKFPHHVVQIQSDTAENYTIKYSISGIGVDQPPIGLFYIEPNSGNIYCTKRVDREEISSYRLMGYAYTHDGYSPDIPVELIIKVEDVNDNAPVFTEEVFCMEILEHSNIGTIVGRLNATDRDEPNSLHTLLRYFIISQTPAPPLMFSMNSEYGIVTAATASLDREVQENYVLIVEVRDMGGRFSYLSSNGKVLIKVLDINDNAPTFTQQSYQTEVNENESGMIILTMPVTDKDLVNTSNWRAKCTITQGNENGYFNITTDPITNACQLRVVKGINYEEIQKILLQVGVMNEVSLITASGTKTSGMSTVPVTVIVKDVDEGPEFQPIIKIIRVRENQTIGTVIGDFKAIDPETKSGQGIIYSVQDSLSWVTIDRTSAQLATAKVLDYESNEAPNHQHNVTVFAVDQSGKTGTGTLVIIVEDVNDNMPLVSRGSNICQTGRSFSVIEADDPDGSPHSYPFHYSVEGPAASQWKVIAADSTGRTARLEPIGDMALGIYEVPIKVVDQQGHGGIQTVRVTKCICPDGNNCSERLADRMASLGGLAILLMVLSALLVAALLCCLLACSCGSGAGKAKLGFPDDAAQQNLIVTNTEAPGADVMDPNFKVPVHISNANLVGNANMSGNLKSGSGTFGQGGRSVSDMGGQQTTQTTKFIRQVTDSSRLGNMMDHQIQDPNRLTYSEWQSFMNTHLGDKLYMCGQDEEHHKGEDYILKYNYEGKGSLAGSVGCCSEIRDDEKMDFLNHLEPKFRTLAEVCAKK